MPEGIVEIWNELPRIKEKIRPWLLWDGGRSTILFWLSAIAHFIFVVALPANMVGWLVRALYHTLNPPKK